MAPKACSERVRVLVLAQQEGDVASLPDHVARWGYEVACVQDVSTALDCIQEHHIQIVLAPWDEGVGLGADFCAQVRQLHDQRYSYIILIVNDSHGAILVRALEAGADDVLTCPLDNNELEARLQSAVRRLALQQQLNVQTEVLGRAHALLAQDLKTVSTLQRSYLPPVHSPLSGVRYQWLSLPSLYVSGDHLNVFQLHDDCVAFYVLDVSGHGVSAAVKSMQVVQMLTDRSDTSVLFEAQGLDEGRVVARPHVVVSRLNALFQQSESDLSYFTMIYGLISPRERSVVFCQAGHPSPLLLTQQKGVRVLGDGGYPVGLFEGVAFSDVACRLGADDVLLLYSDGLTEVLSDQEEPFGDARLLAEAHAFVQTGAGSEGLVSRVARAVQSWGGDTLQARGFQDDVSLLALALSDGPEWVQGLEGVDGLGRDELGFRLMPHEVVRQPVSTVLGSRRRVLIVDDSRSFLRIFEAMLSNWGFEVYTAQDGQEALALIERVLPDFVLSDWDMPTMSGIELCHRVRSQQQHAYMYLIMVTGYASREDLLQSLRMGADDFLTKPVNPSELKVRLGTAARIAQLHISLRQRHEQLLRLYDGLQHDMKEVARIQRTLLPAPRMEPWPCASQSLYHPAEHVCGMLWGELDTPPHLYGFFMVSMRTHDLSAALQVMAFSRWLSSPQAVSVLCHSEGQREKQQWLLADPEQVCQQAIEASSAFIDASAPVDLLYGLLHVRQGVLLLAGVGRWSVLQALPEQSGSPVGIPDHQEAWRHQHILAPGERFFVCPASCFNALGLGVLSEALGSKRMQGLQHPLMSMTAAQSAHGVGGRHLMCLGVQWRESFSYRQWVPDAYQQRAWLLKWKTLAAQQHDLLRKNLMPMLMGDLRALVGYSLVCDTVNVASVGMVVRLFLEQHHVDEVQGYNVDLALSECLTNVMVHAFAGQRPKPVTLAVWVYTGCVCVMVADLGARIPEAEFQRVANAVGFDQDLAVDVLPEGGMGLLFMREVSKRLVYESAGGVNTLWMMF